MKHPSLEKTSLIIANALGLSVKTLKNSFCLAILEDLPQILNIRQQVYKIDNQIEDEKYLHWRYQFRDPNFNGMWVVKKGDEILGVVGIEFGKLQSIKNDTSIVRAMDILVRPNIEGLGLGVWMNLCLIEKYPVIYVVGESEKSKNIIRKLFYPMTAFKTFCYLNQCDTALNNRNLFHPIIISFLNPIIKKSLCLRNYFYKPRIPKIIKFSEVTFFDHRFDELCKSASDYGLIFVGRDAASLNWRFATGPINYGITCCLYGDRLIGYSVTRIIKEEKNGMKKGMLVDWLARPAYKLIQEHQKINNQKNSKTLIRVLCWIFYQAASALTKQGCDAVYATAWDSISQKALKKVGFVFRHDSKGFYVRASDTTLHNQLTNSKDWFLTRFDDDTI